MVTLLDIDDTGASVGVVDEGDSVSLVSHYGAKHGSVTVSVGVRLSTTGLDALLSELMRIRSERGI